MTHILSPGMDPSLVQTGIVDLHVTKVTDNDAGEVIVKFNRSPLSYRSLLTWRYRASGLPVNSELPSLTLRQTPIDWTKPIRVQDRPGLPCLVASIDFKITATGEPLVAILCGTGTDCQVLRTQNNLPVTGSRADWVFENVPPEPVVTVKRMCVGLRGGQVRDGNPEPSQSVIELTYTDGILTEAKVVTPNREPHA